MAMTRRNRIASWTAALSVFAMLAASGLAAEEYTERAAGSRSESIGVHGGWVIDVRNADGSLAAHREFENALQPDGASALVSVLSGANAFGPMAISLDGSAHPCSLERFGIVAGLPCIFAPTAASQLQPTGALVLTGTVTASANGVIDVVSTLSQTSCGAGPSPCGPVSPQLTFTQFSFAGSPIAPIQVVVGQVIQVTVTLSFS